jgi:diguanylate cyclase (GGDEF)-like protein
MTPGRFCVLVASTLPPQVAHALAASPFGPFDVYVWPDRPPGRAPGGVSPDEPLGGVDAVLLDADSLVSEGLQQVSGDTAVLYISREVSPDTTLGWLHDGAQDILLPDELDATAMPRRVRAAIERHRLARSTRRAYATDPATGLPHQQQLIEHLSQLLAVREREPAPMALLALRIEGFQGVAAAHSQALADALRRKVAVRLRAAVRSSDVVAVLEGDVFGVLLASVLSPADAQRVGAKLVQLLLEPFAVAGRDLALAVALGVGQYPQDGQQPEPLLRAALGAAASTPVQGRVGMANFLESGIAGAANDE